MLFVTHAWRMAAALLLRTMLLLTTALLLSAGTAWGQDLNLSINADKSPARPGASVTYTVHVSNSGTSDVTGAEVEVVLPGSTNSFYPSSTSDPSNISGCGTFCEGGETLTWTVGSLAAGESRVLIYRSVISSSASNATITTPATLLVSGTVEATAAADVVIDTNSSVVLDIGSEVSPAATGETFDLRINYGALQGQGGAGFAELSVALPPEVEFVSASGSGTESGSVVSWTLGPIPGGLNSSETITVQANSGLATGTLLDISADLDPGNAGEPAATTARTIPVHPSEPLLVTFSASDVPTVRNTRSDFTITVSNVSAGTVEGTQIRFLLPDFLSSFYPGSTSDPSNISGCGTFCEGGEFLTWTPGNLEPGQVRTLFFETSARDAAFGGALQRFVGLITAPGFAEQTPSYQYGFKSGTVLTVGLDADVAPVPAGGTYTYRITTGVLDFSSGADDATLRLELPEEVTFISATGNPTAADDVVTWSFGPLGAGFSDEQAVTVQADAALNNGQLLKAGVTFDPGTFGESTMRGRLVTPVAPESPLKIALTANDTPANSGTRVDYALTVSNDTQFPITDTEVQLVLGEFLSSFYPSSTNDPDNVSNCGTFCDAGEIMIWEAGTLTAGESKTLYFGTSVSGPGGDISRFRGLANTSRGAEQIFTPDIVIDATPVMAFGLSGAPRPVPSNGNYTYQLNYGAYESRGGASDATMRLLLPDGVTPTSTNGGTISGNAVEWSLGAVGADDGGRRIVEVDIDDGLPEGSLLQARASLSSGNVGETTQRASLPLTTLTSNPLRLTVTPPDAPVQPGQQVTYNFEVENTGSANIASPTAKIVLPDFLSSFYPSSTNDPDNVSNCGTFCDAGEILVWTPPDLTPGQSRTLSFTTNVFSSNLRGDMLRTRLEASGAGASTIYQTVNTGIASEFTLPVELTTFTATTSGEAVMLQWQTASETNNAGFEVERATADGAFERIGFEPGEGTTAEAQTYRFTDAAVPYEAGALAYRLKQVDTDGAFEYSPTVEIDRSLPERMTLLGNYPNPFRSQTALRYELPTASDIRIAVYNTLGQRVATLAEGQKAAGRHVVTFAPRGLPSGTYFVQLRASGQVHTQQVTVIR